MVCASRCKETGPLASSIWLGGPARPRWPARRGLTHATERPITAQHARPHNQPRLAPIRRIWLVKRCGAETTVRDRKVIAQHAGSPIPDSFAVERLLRMPHADLSVMPVG